VLSQCVLSQCVLSQCVLSHCVLSHCVLSQCVLSQCVLSQCVLSQCVLSQCVLSHCALSQSNGYYIEIKVSFSLSSLRVLSADEYVTVNYLCPCPVMLPCSIANTEESSITFPVLYPYPVFPSYLSSSPLLLSYLILSCLVLSYLIFSPSTLTTVRPLDKSL
jgi:hypothetical protein